MEGWAAYWKPGSVAKGGKQVGHHHSPQSDGGHFEVGSTPPVRGANTPVIASAVAEYRLIYRNSVHCHEIFYDKLEGDLEMLQNEGAANGKKFARVG